MRERGHRCGRHRERAADARFRLREEYERYRPDDVTSRTLVDPAGRVRAVLDADPHEVVPGRVISTSSMRSPKRS